MLQIWLPLNGHLNNQGLSSTNGTWVGSSSYDNNGKIGKCVSCNSSHYVICPYNFLSTNKFSQTFWIYIPSTLGNCGLWETVLSIDGYAISWTDYNNLKIYSNNNNLLWWLSSDIFYDKWVHLAIVHTGDNILLYINGLLYGEANSSSTAISSGTIYLGSGIDTTYGPIKFCDYRLYDSALSPKDVHEIAKGLVLHYPMNDEYAESTTNLGNTSATYSNIIFGKEYIASSWGGDAGTVTYYESGGFNNLPYKVYHKTATGTGGIYGKTADDIILEANKTYTMSIWIKASRNFSDSSYSFNINRGSDNYYINYGLSVNFTTEWTRISRTFTTNNSEAGNYGEMSIIYDNGVTDYYVYFSGFQIEEKDHATPYTPSTRNELVYDCSGYCNNGTITGNLQVVEDSPRYRDSISSNGNQEITAPIGLNIPSNNLTVACWVKRPEVIDSNTMRCFLNPGYTNNNRFYFRILPQGNTAIFNVGFGKNIYGTKIIDANWHHLAATTESDGKTINIYVDGVKTNTGTELNAFSIAGNFILLTDFIGKVSDFRFYRTTLSEDDIKELYNTSAIINNNNTLEAYEFSESNTYSINKSGVLEGVEFIEQDGDVLINNTEQVFATEFTEI